MPREPKKPSAAHHRLNSVGPLVRSLRNATEWSQVDLATACQLNHWDAGRDIIAKIESGKRQVTDHELIVLAKVLMVSVAELIGETPLPLKGKELAALLHSRRYAKTAPKVARLLPR
ncbi:MAG: helix-turn-helix transcriptional regulator [Opitutaceae bacterium]|nr:helix-turn-helix transcriptional regulator [Opitutaceae bacterium]